VGRKVRENSWDIVQAHTLAMMRYVPQTVASVFDTLDSMTSVARMLAEVDSRNIMRPLWRLETIKTLQFERAAVRRATAVTVCSDSDGELFERMGARRVMVVPKGVDLDARPHHLPPSGAEIIFVGYFAWRPNVEGALELCDQIFPRIKARVPSTTLTLVGAAPPPGLLSRAGPAVRFTGEVDEVLPHLHSARVTVMPLRAGGGTRIKVLEALSTGAPVVATPFAVEGIAVRDGVHALIAQSPADLAAAAATVIENDELAASLSRAGRALVEQRYGWSTVARPLVDLHRELAELPAGRQRPGVGIGHA
jgi:glycosyltransferase involved in cell wall biosynthesis